LIAAGGGIGGEATVEMVDSCLFEIKHLSSASRLPRGCCKVKAMASRSYHNNLAVAQGSHAAACCYDIRLSCMSVLPPLPRSTFGLSMREVPISSTLTW
jgi:hypothetical protein